MTQLLVSILLLAAAPAPAPPVDWSTADTVDIQLANFQYRPSNLHLKAGQPVILRFTNVAGNDHDFTARKFFASAWVRETDRRAAAGGVIDVRSGRSVEVGLVPVAGRYTAACTHEFHETMGMKGAITVD